MNVLLVVAGELFALFLAILACYLVLLLYRAPRHAKWLESETASTVALLVLMSAVLLSVAYLVQGLLGVVRDPLAAISLGVAAVVAIAWGLWKLLAMRRRLAAADEGRSPFRPGRDGPGGRIGRRPPRTVGHA